MTAAAAAAARARPAARPKFDPRGVAGSNPCETAERRWMGWRWGLYGAHHLRVNAGGVERGDDLVQHAHIEGLAEVKQLLRARERHLGRARKLRTSPLVSAADWRLGTS